MAVTQSRCPLCGRLMPLLYDRHRQLGMALAGVRKPLCVKCWAEIESRERQPRVVAK